MPAASDNERLDRLHQLISDTMQRCTALERVIATSMAAGFSTASADAALAASYHSLGIFKGHLAQVELAMGARRRGPW